METFNQNYRPTVNYRYWETNEQVLGLRPLLEALKFFGPLHFCLLLGPADDRGVDAFEAGRKLGQDQRLLIDPLPLRMNDALLLLQVVRRVLLLQLGLLDPLALADARYLGRRIPQCETLGEVTQMKRLKTKNFADVFRVRGVRPHERDVSLAGGLVHAVVVGHGRLHNHLEAGGRLLQGVWSSCHPVRVAK